MELELKFAELACCEPVGDLVTTQEESMETAIPEYCPDIARIVDTVGQLRLREKHPAGQQLTMGGSVVLTVLYTSEESAGLRSLSMEVPFSCQVEDKRLADCDAVCVTGRLLLAEAKAVTARKLYLRVMPEFTVSGYARRRQRLCCGTEEDPALRVRRQEAELELLHQMARNEGFGKIAALGSHKQKEYFAAQGWGDMDFMNDIAMEQKGLEYSEYSSKESLAQQGGYGLTNKGPQHDEAWLIFMDQVNNQIPTFEDKAEALYYYPMFRTWFGLLGLCKLPWNDIVPADNSMTDEPAKVPEHVDNYLDLYYGVTGTKIDRDDMIKMSERVYNFQRIFNIRLGKGLRANDAIPYRSQGPVTEEEYLSRQERYDGQLVELVGFTKEEVEKMSLKEKMAATRKHREGEYEKLIDAVYPKRGWNLNGVPTIAHLKELGMDLPELLEVVEPLQ